MPSMHRFVFSHFPVIGLAGRVIPGGSRCDEQSDICRVGHCIALSKVSEMKWKRKSGNRPMTIYGV